MLVLTLAAGFLATGSPALASVAIRPVGDQGERPNVVVVLMDDVGRDKVGLYGVGATPPPTPNLDRLAAQGVLFEHAWVYQACSPTRAALLTGRYSDRTGMGNIIESDDGVETPLALSEHLLPEDLPGYRSTLVGKWHLGDVSSPVDHPLLHGFDVFVGWENVNDYFDWVENVNGHLTPRSGYFPAAMGGYAHRAVQVDEQPFFLYYCPKLAHAPYHRPPSALHSYVGQLQSPVVQHKAMVESFDTILGRVLDRVDLSNTYVFVVGDNGSPNITVTSPFFPNKVKGSLFEGGIRVPLIVAGPGIPPGTRCGELVQVTDFFATIRELCGFGPPSQGAEDSVSFASLLRDPDAPATRPYLFVHRFPHPGLPGQDQRAIRTNRWKLIENVDSGNCKLFDLVADPFENDDLLVSRPGADTDRLKARLLQMMPLFP
ncbi:Arylsulfatase precursor [Planctomycetes bacterium Poly30]|uniref:Arylsulfatase n=1 Tax=Saltatorellus ferox TaxID=2528018 RepID=A0A518EWF1_9BACT|nr:Arylsulfatase precursor [Planctomycetes bacterium Poly30]